MAQTNKFFQTAQIKNKQALYSLHHSIVMDSLKSASDTGTGNTNVNENDFVKLGAVKRMVLE